MTSWFQKTAVIETLRLGPDEMGRRIAAAIRLSPQGLERYKRMLHAVTAALAGRGLGILISLISVPLTISYLGAERYGVWIAISSILVWLQLADLGLGNGLLSALSTAYGNDDEAKARQLIADAIVLLTGLGTIVGLCCLAAIPHVNWPSVFNVKSDLAKQEIAPAIMVSVVIFVVSFPLSIIGKVLTAFQEGKITSYWGTANGVICLAALLLATRTQGGLVWLVVAMSGVGTLVNFLSGIWLFTVHRPALWPRLEEFRNWKIGELGAVGGKFFVIQIAALLIFQTDNLIVAHFVGADQVPRYSVAYRLFGYTTLIQTLIFPNLWAAYAEAIARKDMAWVRHSFLTNLTLGTTFTAALAIPLLVFGTLIIKWWAGPAAVPPQSLLYWMALWSIINGAMSSVACLLAASNQLSRQIVYASVTAISNIALSIFFVRRWGITGAIAAPVVAYILFTVGPALANAIFVMKRLSRAV